MRLALRFLRRDWRAGELLVLALATVIAVTSVSAVAFFADRVKQLLVRDAHQMLGGDVLLVADQPWPDEFANEARRRGLAVATITNFISMARAADGAQLAAIKVVSDSYPLRGRLRTAPAANLPDDDARGIPPPGTVWVDDRLLGALAMKVGQSIELGNASLRVERIVTVEPDRGVSFFNMAPRVLLNVADLARTELIQTGSRITYQLAVAGERAAVDAFEAWAKPRLARGQSLQSLENARPEIRAALDRAQQFLGLTALLAVILAAVAVGLATRRYVTRHLDGYAVMRCLGATQARLFSLCFYEFVALSLLASVIGCLLGLAAQAVIGAALAGVVNATLPAPGAVPALQGVITGMVLLVGFALPPLIALKNVPALRVIRRDLSAVRTGSVLAYAIGACALALLLVWQAGGVKLGLYVLGGFAAAIAVFALVAWLFLRSTAMLSRFARLPWRFGLANLRRRSRGNTVQIVSLAVGLVAILMLTFTRADLMEGWRAKIPTDAPNRFVLNIQPDQREAIQTFFRTEGMSVPATYPMVRGRLTAINGKPVDPEAYEDRPRRLVEREFNLSFLTELPRHNSVSAGNWFDGSDLQRGGLSVEEGIAKTLDVKLGDELKWSVAGESFTAPITNLRKLDWDSMQVNFFVITTPKLLEDKPTSFIASFNVPEQRADAMHRLSGAFPNLTIVDMSVIMRQVVSVMEQVIHAVQFVFLFALGAGMLVLYAALLATQDERVQETAVMRALGASRAQVADAQRIEFLAVGFLAGLLAALGASAIGAVLAVQVFQVGYTMNPWVWVAGPLLGVALAGCNAWLGARAATRQSPIAALREA